MKNVSEKVKKIIMQDKLRGFIARIDKGSHNTVIYKDKIYKIDGDDIVLGKEVLVRGKTYITYNRYDDGIKSEFEEDDMKQYIFDGDTQNLKDLVRSLKEDDDIELAIFDSSYPIPIDNEFEIRRRVSLLSEWSETESFLRR